MQRFAGNGDIRARMVPSNAGWQGRFGIESLGQGKKLPSQARAGVTVDRESEGVRGGQTYTTEQKSGEGEKTGTMEVIDWTTAAARQTLSATKESAGHEKREDRRATEGRTKIVGHWGSHF